MNNPVSTYRIQFNKSFTFKDLSKILPYLRRMGVHTVYASPVFEATAGSTHGYDAINPIRINPEIGTEEELRELSKQLKQDGMDWLQDIVPNHMAFDPANIWLMDVLEKGQQSVYAPFFDVAWTSDLYQGRIMVPFLGGRLEDVIAQKELQVAFEGQRFVLKYYDSVYPLNPRSYERLLALEERNAPDTIRQFLTQLHQLRQFEEPLEYSERWSEMLLQLAALEKNEVTKPYLNDVIRRINEDPLELQKLADEQVYRLCHWQETDSTINFRRFFTVNSLICLNIQDKQVLEKHHSLIRKLVNAGIFQGLRVDHIDGLLDPAKYLEELRDMIGDDTYLVVEKILEPGEALPEDWPLQGNTGYDFLSVVNNLLTTKKNEKLFTGFYQDLVKDNTSIGQQLHDKKAYILKHHMGGELENLYHLFVESELVEKGELERVPKEDLKMAIGEFLIQCPVYRYYGNSFPLNEKEAGDVRNILQLVRKNAGLDVGGSLLEEALVRRPLREDPSYNQRAVHFYQRLMQFSGPLMAKGVEDTLMYTYNRFIAHNEVGDSPEAFGLSIGDFHRTMEERQEKWPLSINATATHDTKRGEDARARLNVLSEIPEEWFVKVREWLALNVDIKEAGGPDLNDEYFIYQSLLGNYPFEESDEGDFYTRFSEFLEKALREAKVHSNWTSPDEAYEMATKEFARKLLDKNRPFWSNFREYHARIADKGVINSLTQVLLKFTCPGVADVYQGCESWDLSFVDPDNRRPVDYHKRFKWLNGIERAEIRDRSKLLGQLWEQRSDGEVKFYLVYMLLQLRQKHPELFTRGNYIPLKTSGRYKENVLAFARRQNDKWFVIVAPLQVAGLMSNQDFFAFDWRDTSVLLPAEAPQAWKEVFSGKTGGKAHLIEVQELLTDLPVAVLELEGGNNERGAGILMHITSLPSHFGVGDFGPEAKNFVNFLVKSRQKYWQLLPITPIESRQAYSPYSSFSSMAGNTFLISPELLVKDGLLKPSELYPYHLPQADKVNYGEVQRVKDEILDKAYCRFKASASRQQLRDYSRFCAEENFWLEDFALYVVLKDSYGGAPWQQWPEQYRLRDKDALQMFKEEHMSAMDKTRWAQYVFSRQWKELKKYANSCGIQLIGDIPFYISYDSADVWAHASIFNLDESGQLAGVAGVPPDYFSEDGQLWGMPTFKWDVLQVTGYDWWVKRLKKNFELFDLVRLDHFRSFSDYWEVPATEETAKKGKWLPGPGEEFFKVVQKQLGELKFIAEDLGDIDAPVYELRDKFALPGMKVLQFAFGDDMPTSANLPHNFTRNFVVYTGTHDNNTSRGWYRQDAQPAEIEHLKRYVDCAVGEKNVHEKLARLAYSSVAKIVILPMQDVLGLDESARMNTPGSAENNWGWRMKTGQVSGQTEAQLRDWVELFNRA